MKTDNIASRSTKAFYWGLAGAIIKVAGQLTIQISLARMLDPVVYGQYAAVLVVFGIGWVLADCGFGSALVKKTIIEREDISMAIGWSTLFSTGIAGIIFALAPFFANQFADVLLEPVFKACAFLIPFQTLSNISTSLLRRELNMKAIQIIQVTSYVGLFGGISITMAANGFGVWSLVAGFAAQTVFCLAATYSITRHTLRPCLKGDLALLRFGSRCLTTEIATWCMDNLDRVLIGRFWGIYSLGLYSVAFNLSKAPASLLISASQTIAFASASRLSEDLGTVRHGFLILLAAASLATFPFFLIVSWEASALLSVVYGEKWQHAAPYMAALALAIPLISIGTLTAAILRGIGGIKSELRIQVVTGVMFFGGFFLAQTMSLSVAIWVVPIAYFLRVVLLLIAVRSLLGLLIKDLAAAFRGAIFLSLVTVAATQTAYKLFEHYFNTTSLMPLVLGCSTVMVLFLFRSTWFLSVPLANVIRIRFLTQRSH